MGEPKAIERTEKDREITTSGPAHQRIGNPNVILPQQSAGNLAMQRALLARAPGDREIRAVAIELTSGLLRLFADAIAEWLFEQTDRALASAPNLARFVRGVFRGGLHGLVEGINE